MNAVLAVCGAVSLVGLLVQSQNGGWKVTLPMLVWFAVLLGVAALLASTAARIAVLVVALAGAFVLRSWLGQSRPGVRR